MPLFPPTPERQSAFTLLEVIAALGIFTFALTSLLGLMAVGLDASRKSLDIASASQLADYLANRIERMSFAEMPTANDAAPLTVWFDELGNEVSQNSTTRLYQATVSTDTSASDNLRRARITVTRGGEALSFCYLFYNNQ